MKNKAYICAVAFLCSFSSALYAEDEESNYIEAIWECEPRFIYYRSIEIEITINKIITKVKNSKCSKKSTKKIIRLCNDILFQLYGDKS